LELHQKNISRCGAEPNVSPPGCATSHWRDEYQFCELKKWLTWHRPLRDREINYRLIIYSHRSTQRENLVKLDHDPVDIQIFVLAEIVEKQMKKKTKQKQNI